MIKNLFISIILAFIMFGCASSSVYKYDRSTSKEQTDIDKKQDYNRGYKKALKDEKLNWIKIGYKKAKETIGLYFDRIERLEAGKYADAKNLLTPAEIFTLTDPNTGVVTMDSLGCKIERQFNLDEIMKMYQRSKALEYNPYEDKKNNSLDKALTSVNSNSITLINNGRYQNATTNINPNPGADTIYYINFKKTISNRNVLARWGVKCSTAESDYICAFKNKSNYDDFCSKTRICEVDK